MLYVQRSPFGVFYFRMPIPKNYHDIFGKKEIKFSLKTKDKTEAKILASRHIQNFICKFQEMNISSFKIEDKTLSISEKVNEKIVSIEDLMKKYFSERRLIQKTESQFRNAVRRFLEVAGNKKVNEYKRADLLLFKDKMIDFPSRVRHKDLALPVDKLLVKYKDTKKIESRTLKSRYMDMLSTLFNYAVANDYIKTNPVSGIRISHPKKVEPARLPFSIEQLNVILQSEIFTKQQSPQKIEYRWIILLSLFTGARLEEICRLRKQDVLKEDNISFVFIRPDESHRLKTISSYRRIPLHSKIFDLGFQNYIDALNGEFLFPVMNSKPPVNGKVSQAFGKWFGRYLMKIGVKNSKICFHSFRHTLKAMCRRAGIPKEIIDALAGHAQNDTASSYGKDEFGSVFTLRTLSDAVERIADFQKLNFSKF